MMIRATAIQNGVVRKGSARIAGLLMLITFLGPIEACEPTGLEDTCECIQYTHTTPSSGYGRDTSERAIKCPEHLLEGAKDGTFGTDNFYDDSGRLTSQIKISCS